MHLCEPDSIRVKEKIIRRPQESCGVAAGVWVTLLPTHLPLDIQMVSVLLKLGNKMALTSGFPKIGNASEQLVNLVPRASAPSEDKPIHGFVERWAKSVGESLGCVLRGDMLSPVFCPHSLHPASQLLVGRASLLHNTLP